MRMSRVELSAASRLATERGISIAMLFRILIAEKLPKAEREAYLQCLVTNDRLQRQYETYLLSKKAPRS